MSLIIHINRRRRQKSQTIKFTKQTSLTIMKQKSDELLYIEKILTFLNNNNTNKQIKNSNKNTDVMTFKITIIFYLI